MNEAAGTNPTNVLDWCSVYLLHASFWSQLGRGLRGPEGRPHASHSQAYQHDNSRWCENQVLNSSKYISRMLHTRCASIFFIKLSPDEIENGEVFHLKECFIQSLTSNTAVPLLKKNNFLIYVRLVTLSLSSLSCKWGIRLGNESETNCRGFF